MTASRTRPRPARSTKSTERNGGGEPASIDQITRASSAASRVGTLENTNTPLTPPKSTASKLAPPQANPFNLQAVKRYIFNETGNIMLASTELGSEVIADSVRDVFAEVSVFFAAMTKAISTSIDPATGTQYSLYNYNAIQNVVDGSGLFVHVTEEDIVHTTSSFGATFSQELIEGLLGLATGVGALAFAQGMIASIGSAGLKIGGNSDASDNKVANIVFICEYLLGMPIVSAMVVSCDAKENSQTFSTGPCFSETTTSTSLTMHKDTYMFVTPKFIRNYSSDLDSIDADLAFLEFVDYLQALVQGQPIITAVETLTGNTAPSVLQVGTTYAMTGAFLDNKGTPGTVKVQWVPATGNPTPVATAEVQANLISFSVAEQTTPMPIGVYFGTQLAVASPMVFTAAKTT
jgi:hypothetical protein